MLRECCGEKLKGSWKDWVMAAGYKDLPDEMKVQFACVWFILAIIAICLGFMFGIALLFGGLV